jgi:hypothetical protein
MAAKKDKPDFPKLKQRADQLVAAHASRNTMYAAMKKFLFMEWDERPTDEWVKETMSPDPYNAIVGIVRLLVSTQPRISVAADENDPNARQQADKLELALGALWNRANDRPFWSIHYDVALSAVLFSEIAIQIANAQETIRWAEVQGKSTGELKEAARRTPFVYEVCDPETVYPQFGAFGLRSVLRRYRRPAWQVKEFWGNKAGSIADADEDREVEYSDYWTPEWRVVWTNADDAPILMEKHELPFIPWSCSLVMGSSMFTEPHRQRLPLLYPVWKGKWWHRQNLELTLLYSFASLLVNPTWVTKTVDGQAVAFDLSQPGGQINLRAGENIEPLARQLITGDITSALSIADNKITASTVPQVVFGQAPGSSMSYSALNMLSQGGRLPLVPIEQNAGRAIGTALQKTLLWVKHSGQAVSLYNVGRLAKLSPEDINPDHLEITVKLKADIPQDRLQLANTVTMLMNAKGADGLPLISRDTALAFLEFLQPGEETEKILQELFTQEHLKMYVKEEAERSGMLADMEAMHEEPPLEGPAGQGFDMGAGGLPPVLAQGPGQPQPMAPGGPQMPGMGGNGGPNY